MGQLPVAAALVVGFAVHNTTEGVAVIAPLTRQRVSTGRLLGLGLVAGAPAVLGTVLGATVTTPGQAASSSGWGSERSCVSWFRSHLCCAVRPGESWTAR